MISVAIPARNDGRRLERTLHTIARSSLDLDRVEVVVADDGSEDGTCDMLAQRDDPFALEIRRGDWGSQSAATNEAIRHCGGTYVLLCAQDILFHEDLLAEHLKWHRRFPDEAVGVIGKLLYPERLAVTPFLFYLVNGGLQFAYYLIKDPLRVPPNFVYAPNFSVRRATLERVGLFDEELPYGCQDTDLGIRLTRAGVRLVYNARAVGFHDHPTDLGAFCTRHEKVAAGKVRLQQKHPDHEDHLPCWDVVLSNYLGHSRVRHDLDLESIEAWEQELADHADYQALWTRGWVRGEDPSRFTDAERQTLRLVDRLFNAYTRTLQFHWARGYLAEARSRLGDERVREVLGARLSKMQGSAQTQRLIAKRLMEWGLADANRPSTAYMSARIVHGIRSYRDALRIVEPFQWPQAAAFAQQVLLVVERDRLSDEERARLDEAAEVVACRTIDEGILRALRSARAPIVTVCSAGVAVAERAVAELVETVFERVPEIVALGGGIREPSGERIKYGYRLADGGRVEPLLRSPADATGAQPVEAAIADYLVLRGSALARVLDSDLDGSAWNLTLCRRLSERGGKILHLPQLVAESARAHSGRREPAGVSQ